MPAMADRLPRLLALVPYLLARPGIPIAEAAADFDVTVRQLRRDLELLWMCGLPGYGPGDLIDLSFEAETVTVTFDAGMRRPLRLTTAEATALMVALRALAETPEVTDAGIVRRALAKIETAAGQAERDSVVVGPPRQPRDRADDAAATVTAALDRGRALYLHYYTASRDARSERTVDPMRLILMDGNAYLEAWCRAAGAVRLFRLDRIDRVRALDEAAEPPPGAHPVDVSTGVFPAQPDQRVATLRLGPQAHWVAEYYPVHDVEDAGAGAAIARLRYADTEWMVRLVLGLGSGVTVLDPPDLADAARQCARAALQRARHRVDAPGG